MKRYRLLVIVLGGLVALLLGVLVFGNLNSNLVYYLKPREALSRKAEFDDGRRFKLGGMVAPDSVRRTPEGLRFAVAAGTAPDSASVPVVHHGAPAQLFRSGVGVVLEGAWKGSRFVSDSMMVRHDENYQPPTKNAGGARR